MKMQGPNHEKKQKYEEIEPQMLSVFNVERPLMPLFLVLTSDRGLGEKH